MKRVTYAKLQGTDAFIPGIGGVGTTLPPTGKTLKDLKMFDNGEGILIIQLKGAVGQPIEAGVPLTNVQILVYANESPKVVAENVA